MNVKLLRKVKKHILEEPRRLRMTRWIIRDTPGAKLRESAGWGEPDNLTVPKCGTVGCIAGWACILSKVDTDGSIRGHAKELLGIDETLAARLFEVDEWPDAIYQKYLKSRSQKSRAVIAAERIEHFISTKGAE